MDVDKAWATLALIVVVATLSFCVFARDFLKMVYLSNRIEGPSLWTTVTVHARKLQGGPESATHLTELCRQYGFRPFKLWAGTQCAVVLSDPDSIKEVFKTSKYISNKPNLIYRELKEFLGKASLVNNEAEWKHHRNVISPVLHKNMLEPQMDFYHDGAEELVRKLGAVADQENPDLDVAACIEEQILRITSLGMSSGNFAFEDEKIFCRYLQEGMAIVQQNMIYPFRKYIGRQAESVHMAKQSFVEMLAQQRNLVAARSKVESEHLPLNVLDLMVQGNLKTGDVLTEKEFCEELLFLLFASVETSSTAIVVTLLLLALHQKIQERVFDEVDSILGVGHKRLATATQDLDKMQYLEMVIKESIRLFPPVPTIARYVGRDINLNGLILPKGIAVGFHLMALHRNPNTFDDPLKFDPDRFLPEKSANHHPFGFLPFSYGPRNCPGKAQAMMAVKILLSRILLNYRILPGDKLKCIDDIKFKMYITLHLSDPSIRLISRNGKSAEEK